MKMKTIIAKLMFLVFIIMLICSVRITAFASEQAIKAAPTLSELETMARSRNIKTRSNTGVRLILPTKKEMLDEPFLTYTDNGKHHGSIYIMPKPKAGNGYLGTVATDTVVWIVAETAYYYFFVTDDGWMGWNGKSYFSGTVETSTCSAASTNVTCPELPTLNELETMARSHSIKTRSNTGEKLQLPTTKQMLNIPFRTYTDNGKEHGSIYIMPIPQSGHGYLGTVKTGTEVWIVAETDYYYFFLTDDGWMGWNGKSYFR